MTTSDLILTLADEIQHHMNFNETELKQEFCNLLEHGTPPDHPCDEIFLLTQEELVHDFIKEVILSDEKMSVDTWINLNCNQEGCYNLETMIFGDEVYPEYSAEMLRREVMAKVLENLAFEYFHLIGEREE